MKYWIRRQWCRSGLHRYTEWTNAEKDGKQHRWCEWCRIVERRNVDVFSIGEILMEFAKRKG